MNLALRVGLVKDEELLHKGFVKADGVERPARTVPSVGALMFRLGFVDTLNISSFFDGAL